MEEVSELVRQLREAYEDLNSALRNRGPEPSSGPPQRFSWQPPIRSNDPPSRSDDSLVEIREADANRTTLGSLERKMDSVRADTSELLRRIPCDLREVIEQAKDSILVRIDSMLHSHGSDHSLTLDAGLVKPTAHSNRSELSVAEQLWRLTPRERAVFRICFESGFLTYRELGEKLGLSPVGAKNVVNALLRHPHKSGLLTKAGTPKEVRVGVAQEVSAEVLRAKAGKSAPKWTA
jgi:DNA-binding CsgD family transcriptional regulator